MKQPGPRVVRKYPNRRLYDTAAGKYVNLEEIAAWCQGEVRTEKKDESSEPVKYVHVPVHRPLNEKQIKGYVGDWVLQAANGFKVYTDRAFIGSFELVDPALAAHL